MATRVHELELDNGFRALLVPRRNLPVVASTVWYTVGSRDERSGETGLSHFLEHMMFKGTDRYAKGEIDLLTAKMGGANNAFTSQDMTAYYFSLASDRWETALEIEASRMRGCLLDPAEFAAEKKVVLEELAMGEDDPWHNLYHAIEALSYQVHPYHHPIIGWREDLERVDVDGMRGYYARHYGPNRAFLCAAGDFDVARAERRVRELFEDLPRAEERAPVLAEPKQRGARRAVQRFTAATDLVRIAICFPTCRMGERDDFVLDVVSQVLGASKTGRLYRRLVLEEQLATTVWVGNEVRLDPGLLSVSVELREGASPERVEDVVREELALLGKRGAKAGELSRARTQLRSGHLFEEETALDVALRIGRFEAVAQGGYRAVEDALAQYDSVTAAEVGEVVRRYTAEDRWNVVWLVPDRPAKARKARRR